MPAGLAAAPAPQQILAAISGVERKMEERFAAVMAAGEEEAVLGNGGRPAQEGTVGGGAVGEIGAGNERPEEGDEVKQTVDGVAQQLVATVATGRR